MKKIQFKRHFATSFMCLNKNLWFQYTRASFPTYLIVLAPNMHL